MKSKLTLFLELAISLVVVFALSGCFGDGGSSSAYDGTWTVGYVDSAFVAPAPATASGVVSCSVQNPLPTISLANGIGSTSQTDSCTGTAAPSGTTDFIYLINVTVTPSTGAMRAVVNGGTLTGQCISTRGCAAQNGTASISLTR